MLTANWKYTDKICIFIEKFFFLFNTLIDIWGRFWIKFYGAKITCFMVNKEFVDSSAYHKFLERYFQFIAPSHFYWFCQDFENYASKMRYINEAWTQKKKQFVIKLIEIFQKVLIQSVPTQSKICKSASQNWWWKLHIQLCSKEL